VTLIAQSLLRTLIIFAATSVQLSVLAQISYDTVYTKLIGNSQFHTEGLSLIELSADSILWSTGYHGGLDYCDWRPKLYITNAESDTIWSTSDIVGGRKIIATSDGNFVNIRQINVPSNCTQDTLIVSKFNIMGDTLWVRKFYFGTGMNRIGDIVETADSGLAIICSYETGFSWNSRLIKLNGSGITEWTKVYSSSLMRGLSLANTSDDGFGILFKDSPISYKVIRTNSFGDSLWSTIISDSFNVSGRASIETLPDDNFLITGATINSGFLARVSNVGSLQFHKFFSDSVAGNSLWLEFAKYIPSKNVYAFLTTRINITDTLGNLIWSSSDFDATFMDIIETSNGDLMALGYRYIDGTEKIFAVRFQETTTNIVQPGELPVINIYPNPTSGTLSILFDKLYQKVELALFDIRGRRVMEHSTNQSRTVNLNIEHLAEGMYVLRVQAEGLQSFNTKLLKEN